MAARVIYCEPNEFIARLPALPQPAPTAPKAPEMRRGYKIKRSEPKLSAEEQQQREGTAIRAIAEAMRRKGK